MNFDKEYIEEVVAPAFATLDQEMKDTMEFALNAHIEKCQQQYHSYRHDVGIRNSAMVQINRAHLLLGALGVDDE